MPSASALRAHLEASLAHRMPAALTPRWQLLPPVASTGIAELDRLLLGGLPLGAITEIVGPECAGRSSLALAFLAQQTQAGKVCAWVDASDSLAPESAAAIGVVLPHLLWIRCGVASPRGEKVRPKEFTLPETYLVPRPIPKGLHGGGCGRHPREETKGLSTSVGELLHSPPTGPQCAQPNPPPSRTPQRLPGPAPISMAPPAVPSRASAVTPWSRLEQALQVTDLLLQASGFSSIVLDLGGLSPEQVTRVPLATWFRYRAAAERTQACVLLLTQHGCARSSAGLGVLLEQGNVLREAPTVFTGVECTAAVVRRHSAQGPDNVLPMRKPPQRERSAHWQIRTPWAGHRGTALG